MIKNILLKEFMDEKLNQYNFPLFSFNILKILKYTMQNNSNEIAELCLKKLETLKKKIQRLMQIRQNANCFNKYRINFEITQPTNLVGGTLQQHQLQSLEWMINLASQEANGILADDMGLGKTIQAISYMAYLKQENGIRGKHLIICPKSVSTNWMRQIKKWFPSSRAALLVNTELQRQNFINEVIRPRKFDILVTTFEGAKKCLNLLGKIKWEVIVVDQAHKIKNFESQNFQTINYYQATFKMLLSGTPLSNNLKELWTLLYFIMPQLFNDPSLFDQIEQSVYIFEGTEEEKLNFRMKIAKYFHTIINPFFKRRSKKDLQLGLPPKIQKTLYVPLSKMQLQMYKNFIRYGSVYGDGHYPNRNTMNARKICLHPYLFPNMWPENQEAFGQHAIENCGKLKVLDKLLKKLLQQSHKVLIFSQFTLFLDILQEYCQYRQFKYCRLDGSTDLQERDQLMSNFNNTNMYQIFMLSTKAGGLGINLTGADRVIIYDIDWNPQNDIQAMDRAYRIGQTKAVHVYKMITQFTIEERISQFQRYKLIWDQLVIQKGAFMAKKQMVKDDPFSNVSVQSLAKIGKGQIFRLKADQAEKSIEEIEQIGDQKNKELDHNIRKKLQENVENYDINKFNPFEQDTEEFIPDPNEDQSLLKRRNYETFQRQRHKFERYNVTPPFKFYVKLQKIKELEFELHMELKRAQNDRSEKIISYLKDELNNIYNNQRFQQWSEKEFEDFVDAHQLYLEKDYKNIAQFIKTKTLLQVQSYSRTFFEKAPNNERLEKQLQRIMISQELVKLRGEQKNKTKREQIKDNLIARNSSKEPLSSLKCTILTQQLMQKQIADLIDKKKEKQVKKAASQEKQLKKQKEKQQKIKLKQNAKRQKAERWARIIEQRKQNQLKRQAQKQVLRKAKLESKQLNKKQKLVLQKLNFLNEANQKIQQLSQSQNCSSTSTQKKNYDKKNYENTNQVNIRTSQIIIIPKM